MRLSRTLNLVFCALLGSALACALAGGATPAIAARRPTPTPRRPTATPILAPTATPQPTPTCWNVAAAPNIPGNATVLTGVSGTGSNDGWAVGYASDNGMRHTLTLHWDGASWVRVPSPDVLSGVNSTNQLNGVVAIAPNDAWAVGYSVSTSQPYQTLTLHWNGVSWTIVPSPNLPPSNVYNALNAVSASGPNEVWAVGGAPGEIGNTGRAILMRWTGSAWTLTPEPPETAAGIATSRTGVTAVSANDVWAVGAYLAFHWNGSNWSVSANSGQNLLGIAHANADNVWAVGTNPGYALSEGGTVPASAFGQRFHNATWANLGAADNTTLSQSDTGFNAVSVVSPTNVWAVGQIGRFTLTEQWDGSVWHIVASANGNPNPNPNSLMGNVLNSVHANSMTDIWAVGYYWDSTFSKQLALIERYSCQ